MVCQKFFVHFPVADEVMFLQTGLIQVELIAALEDALKVTPALGLLMDLQMLF